MKEGRVASVFVGVTSLVMTAVTVSCSLHRQTIPCSCGCCCHRKLSIELYSQKKIITEKEKNYIEENYYGETLWRLYLLQNTDFIVNVSFKVSSPCFPRATSLLLLLSD